MKPVYATPKKALDALLASNSSTKTAQILGVHRANIFHYLHRYDKDTVPPVVKQALIDKGYVKKRMRIRSQINWETEEQKQYFLDYIQRHGYESITEFARDKAEAHKDGRLYDVAVTLSHDADYLGEVWNYPIGTGENL